MRALLAIAASLLAGCGPAAEEFHFPSSFLFGTATAGFQVEMGCPTLPAAECEDRSSDWYEFITRPELVKDAALYISGQPPTQGPGFFELYPHDLDLARDELHGTSLRISFEWSRLFPTATDGIEGQDALRKAASPAALAYYHALLGAMKARGLKPLVTLNHYTLPSWLHDAYGCHTDLAACTRRGWLDKDRAVREIAKYSGFVAAEFGGEVDLWATLNEPFTGVAIFGYLAPNKERANPPGVSLQGDAAKAVTLAMIEGHARMYDAVRLGDTVDADGDGQAARIGLVYNLQAAAADNPDEPLDVQAAKNLDYLMQELFLNAVILGDLDASFDGTVVHRDDLAHRMDFLGVNYYARAIVEGAKLSFLPQLSPLLTFNFLNLKVDWTDPTGIYEVLTWAADRYHLPMIVTETGREDPRDDGSSASWVVQSMAGVQRAIEAGVNVEGYFYWSLMDNWEWNHGMNVRMGLYAIDPLDPMKRRVARSGVAAYGRIAESGKIPADLKAKYP